LDLRKQQQQRRKRPKPIRAN